MNPEKIICKCRRVTKGDLLAVLENGASSYKEVRAMTGAGSQCAKCKIKVKTFIKKHRKLVTPEQESGNPNPDSLS